jgi:hypothetical protein
MVSGGDGGKDAAVGFLRKVWAKANRMSNRTFLMKHRLFEQSPFMGKLNPR